MEAELDINIIKATQTSLGKYVKRPPLSEKLLKKPPFRFIHDIITSVLKSTGFFDGLFDENELISDNVKDRESKVAFLNKIIFVIAHTTGRKLLVKSSKIVAGQEPEKTNELLQCLAEALDKKLSSDDAVRKFKESKNAPSGEKPSKDNKIDSKKSPIKSKDKSIKTEKNQVVKKVRENSNTRKSTTTIKNNLQQQKQQQNKPKAKEKPKTNSNEVKNEKEVLSGLSPRLKLDEDKNDMTKESEILNSEVNNVSLNSDSKTSFQTSSTSREPSPRSRESIRINTASNQESVENANIEKSDLNNLANIENDTKENESDNLDLNKEKTPSAENDSGTTVVQPSVQLEISNTQNVDNLNKRPSSVRPTSSRPSAPRIREKHDNILASTINVIAKVNIISENTVPEDEEESSIIVQNTTEADETTEQLDEELNNQHGRLVQQILDSQKEYSQISGKTEIEWQFEAQKTRDDVNKDIEQLRFNIQAISRIANPLGKLLDHIQEDVEVMRQESIQWFNSHEETTKELSKQKLLNEELLLPLHAKMKQVELEITEKQEKINDLKIIIHKNNNRIERLLSNGTVQ